jgi:hypothetical protein
MKSNMEIIEFELNNALYGRGDVDGLLAFMKDNGFYTSPASGSHHLCCEGGLAQHSINVLDTMLAIRTARLHNTTNIPIESLVIAALLHDLGKIGDFEQSNYVVNMIKDGRPTKAEPEQKYKQSESKPYVTNPDIPYVDHEIRSVEYIRRFVELTQEEYQAILWHNGLYGTFKYQIQNKETPLYLLLHFADMWASRVMEV